MAIEPADQAPVQSAEDRVSALFEDQEAPAEPTPEAQPEAEAQQESDVAEVEFEGARYQVPKALEKGLLQQADYTRKTQELADQRRVLDQSLSTANLMMMENEFHQSLAEDVHNLKSVEKHLESLDSVNLNDLDSDALYRHLGNIRQAESFKNKLQKKIDTAHGEFKAKFQASLNEAKSKAHDLLSKQIAGYTAKSFDAVREYAKSQGFTDAVLESVETDPKAVSALYKAMKYDELQSGKIAAVKKLDAPVVKPGASKPMPQEVKDKLNYKKALASAKTRDERNAIVQKRVEGMF